MSLLWPLGRFYIYNKGMSLDIGRILDDWPFESGKVTARRIHGDDGRDKIQLRLDLGLYQMETTGRPDGQRPQGCDTLLAYHEQRLQAFRQQTGSEEGFELDEGACEQLRAEGVMFYHRYLAEFILEDYEAVERDTRRNLRLMDFCARHAKEESDRFTLEQYRPYVLMMCARARALLAFQKNRPKAALSAIREGIEGIKDFFRRFGPEQAVADSSELAILRAMAKEIESRIPEDPITKLRRDLAKAVREERYEDAASLRDQLKTIHGQDPSKGGKATL
jgi:hypothetical protein